MDLGIPKCAITGYPNKFKMSPLALKSQIQATNINYKNEHIPILSQNEPHIFGNKSCPLTKMKNTNTHHHYHQSHKTMQGPRSLSNHYETKN